MREVRLLPGLTARPSPIEEEFGVEDLPEGLAVPTVLLVGTSGAFAELPKPLGSFPELFSPPTFAGPLGTPLTPWVPAPAEPALGEPAGLVAPLVGPLAAPPADAPPAEAPPDELPPPPPPPPPPP
jgi:hypothetical protein